MAEPTRDPADVLARSTSRHGAASGASFLVVLLPWPKRILWPNGRSHWGTEGKARKRYRDDARLLTLCELAGRTWGPCSGVRVTCEFRPPVARSNGTKNASVPDRDGCVGAIKSGFDGIADALGVNDRTFQLERPTIGARVVLGEVFVKLEAIP